MSFQRLFNDIIPVNYQLTVKPEFNSYTFEGNLVIELQVSLSNLERNF